MRLLRLIQKYFTTEIEEVKSEEANKPPFFDMLTEDAARQIKQMHKNRGDAHQIIVSTLFFMMVQKRKLLPIPSRMLLVPFPCCRDDFFHVDEARLPAEDAARLVAGSDELRGVACTACADFCRDLLARRLLCGGDHFLDREALSVAEVKDVALAALPQYSSASTCASARSTTWM